MNSLHMGDRVLRSHLGRLKLHEIFAISYNAVTSCTMLGHVAASTWSKWTFQFKLCFSITIYGDCLWWLLNCASMCHPCDCDDG